LSSEDVTSKITAQMGSLTGYVEAFELMVVAISAVILAVLFANSVGSRRKDFAVLRMMGATRGHIVSMALYESAVVSALGALAGIVLALAFVLPLSGIIGDSLGMPYISPSLASLVPAATVAFAVAFVIGPLSSLAAAFSLSRKDIHRLFREGE